MSGVRRLKSGTWQGWYFDYTGVRRYFTLGRAATKRQVQQAAAAKAVEAQQIRLGVRPVPALADDAQHLPITEFFQGYLTWGRLQGGIDGRPWSAKHLETRTIHLGWWQHTIELRVLGDCLGMRDRVEQALHMLADAGRAGKTLYSYQEALAAFCDWCVDHGYLREDPLADPPWTDTSPRSRRRLLTREEIHRLLEVSPAYRRLLYETALCTGLRANELRQLTPAHLDQGGIGVHLDAAWTKNRQPGWHPLPAGLLHRLMRFAEAGRAAAIYREMGAGPGPRQTFPSDPLLYVPRLPARMLYRDLAAASIPKQTAEGKVDFHALRLAYINYVISHGATPTEAQTLARHASMTLTLGVYGRTQTFRLRHVVEAVATDLLPTAEWDPTVHAQAQAVGNPAPRLTHSPQSSRALRLLHEGESHPRKTTDTDQNAPISAQELDMKNTGGPETTETNPISSPPQSQSVWDPSVHGDDPRLADIIDQWPTLSEPVKQQMLALITQGARNA